MCVCVCACVCEYCVIVCPMLCSAGHIHRHAARAPERKCMCVCFMYVQERKNVFGRSMSFAFVKACIACIRC